MVFFKKWLKNHPQFLLHFLIHIVFLMLCRKFELILTNIFLVMAIFKNQLHFLIHIDVLMLCRKFELIPTNIFRVMAILKIGQFLKKSQGYSPLFFPKNGSKITQNILLHFLIHIDVHMLCKRFELFPT